MSRDFEIKAPINKVINNNCRGVVETADACLELSKQCWLYIPEYTENQVTFIFEDGTKLSFDESDWPYDLCGFRQIIR